MAELSSLPQKTIHGDLQGSSLPHISSGHLLIEGNVSGAKVEIEGNIVIMGNCAQSSIQSHRGTIFMLYGSSQENHLLAKQNIFLKYCTHSKVEAGEKIVIETDILNSELCAGTSLCSEHPEGKIFGGKVQAKESIFIPIVGNEKTSTFLEVEEKRGIIEARQFSSLVEIKMGGCRLQLREAILGGKISFSQGKLWIEREEGKLDPLL